ncbi:MAG: glycosyltransferase [Thermoproteota archaeon]
MTSLLVPEQSIIDIHERIQLSVVIPVYNQQSNISSSLSRIKQILDSALIQYELVLVNDGSQDDTLKILKNEERVDSRIRVISYTPNMGKGFAVKTGVVQSRGDIIIFTDGDLDISPDVIANYIKELTDFDMVIASKRHPLSVVDAPLSRKILSRAFNLVVQIGTGIKIEDTQAGLKAGKGDVLRKIFSVMVVKRYAFDVELLAIATLLRLQIKELPVTIHLDRRFKIKDIMRMFVDVLGISYRYRIKRWYQERINLVNQ